MKIGITGGAGFIGSWVAQRAAAMGHQPVILDRTGDLTGTVGKLVAEGRAAIMLGDVRDATALQELAAHTDGIIHLAACLGTQETINNPFPAAETNILGGLNFLQACRFYGIPGVYIGVGNHWMENSYSITKTTVERFVRMYNQEHGTRVNVVRLVNAYGPGQSVAPPFGAAKVRKITPAFACRALTGQAIEVYGDGEQVSDMVHVSDGATALIRALEQAAAGRVFDRAVEVGPARSLTVNQVAAIIRDAAAAFTGQPPVDIVHLPMRPGEIPGARVSANVSTLALVGMAPMDLVGAEEGLSATVAWFGRNWLPGYLQAANDAQADAEPAADPIAVAFPARHNPTPGEGPEGATAPDFVHVADAQQAREAVAANPDAVVTYPAAPDFTAAQAHGTDH